MNDFGESLSFAQISDPHLTTLNGVRPSELLNKRILGYLSWLKRRRAEHQRDVLEALVSDLGRVGPGHLIITGDLTHIGLPAEFEQVKQWLHDLGSSDQITLVPGNHDAYARANSGQTLDLWQEYTRSDPASGHQADGFPSLRIRGPAAIVGLSSALPTAPFLATGRIGREQLGLLPEILDSMARRGLFRILVLHHSPAPGVDNWRKRLTDRSRLQTLLARHGAELVLHGHSHRTVWSELPGNKGNIPVIGTPSASALGRHGPERRAAYHLYRLQAESRHWRLQIEARGYDVVGNGFNRTAQRELLIAKS